MQAGPQAEITAQRAITYVFNNIIPHSNRYQQLTDFAVRNGITIRTLIDGDTFGEAVSDFPTDYPNATLLDQLNILKAFIENTDLAGFDIPTITGMLREFSNRVEERKHNLETVLDRALPWGMRLPTNLDASLKLLDQIQILNYIEEKALAAAPEEQAAFQDILNWARTKRNALCTQRQRPAPVPHENETAYIFLGADRFSRLIRSEIASFIELWHRLKLTVTAVATFNRFPLRRLLTDGFLITLRLGLTFLLPWRLALTACREGTYWVEQGIYRLGHYLAPNNRGVEILFSALSLLVGCYLVFQYVPYFSLRMILDFQFFPDTWSFSFIFATSLTCSALELAVGAVLGVGQRIAAYVRRDPVPAAALNVNEGQRQALLTLLATRLDDEDTSLEDRQTIGRELDALNEAEPYLVSQFDQALLQRSAQNNTLPAVFEPVRDRIAPRLNPA